MSGPDVIDRVKKRKQVHGAQMLGGGVAAIVFAVLVQAVSAATIGMSIISIPLYLGGGLAFLAGIYMLATASVEPSDVRMLRLDAARARRAGNLSRADHLEREAAELATAFNTQDLRRR